MVDPLFDITAVAALALSAGHIAWAWRERWNNDLRNAKVRGEWLGSFDRVAAAARRVDERRASAYATEGAPPGKVPLGSTTSATYATEGPPPGMPLGGDAIPTEARIREIAREEIAEHDRRCTESISAVLCRIVGETMAGRRERP